MYATVLQLLQRYGNDEIAKVALSEDIFPSDSGDLLYQTVINGDRSAWTAQEIAAADQALIKINLAVDDAQKHINSYLVASNYTLPLSQEMIDNSDLSRSESAITRYYLYDDDPTEEVGKRFKNVIAWLKDLSTGKASLGAEDTSMASNNKSHIRQGNSGFNWGAY
jgi:phage gp36-like protein